MANTKLDRIERDIEKTRAKILEYDLYIFCQMSKIRRQY